MYKIIIDSSGELSEELKSSGHYCNVALSLDVDGEIIKDDESFNQKSFLEKVKASVAGPKSACPSPEAFIEAFGDAEHVYMITLSGELSGSYNSAVLAKNLYEDEHEGEKKIHVFNSKSASIGETIIGMKIQELEEAGLPFEEIVEKTEEYINSVNTFFVLETLETFVKTGRLSRLKGRIVETLNIKPIMASTETGYIRMLSQGRGMKKALSKMVEEMVKLTKNCEDKVIAISHCNCPERAQYVKELIEKAGKFKQVIVLDMRGVSSMYANDGGVIIAV